MKLAWLTDIHLNFLDKAGRDCFYHKIKDTKCDAVLISGDIAEAPSIVDIMQDMMRAIDRPIYFVLGNHDYYRGDVCDVRKQMRSLTQAEELLYWLPVSGPIVLERDVVLIGQDGWADGRYGDYSNSQISLNDSRMITDLFQQKLIGKYQLLEKMQQLADEDAEQLRANMLRAINSHPKKIIICTHVPPFAEACCHQGKQSDDDWLPYFSSQAIGDVLMQFAAEYSDVEFLVLCGHTHEKCFYRSQGNLVVHVGQAEYYYPEVQKIIDVSMFFDV
ncbi:MAG: metallophosphoesterase [Gammaproteobacteria bacterium]|nr:metallophosphoesterase [Gammaproteobacteria bacterium]